MDEKERSQRRFSIGNQLMLAVLTLSLIFTVIISTVSLYRVFHEDLAHLDVELKQVESSYLSSFSASLWVEDRELLLTQAQGAMRMPSVDYLRIASEDEVIIELGSALSEDVVERSWPMQYRVGDKTYDLAILTVQSDLSAIYEDLWQQFFFSTYDRSDQNSCPHHWCSLGGVSLVGQSVTIAVWCGERFSWRYSAE